MFNYEGKIWGFSRTRIVSRFLGALRLKYCLESLVNKRGRVVEIGCGGGGMSEAIKFYRPDLEIVGCDVSSVAIGQAKNNFKNVEFIEGSIYNLPFKNGSFDAVVMFDLLEHLEDPEVGLSEVTRILRRGGVFHSFTPCEGEMSNYDFWFRKFGWHGKEIYAGHIQKYRAVDLIKKIESHGFSLEKKFWSNHFFNQVADALYFLFLSLRGRNAGYSLEGYVAAGKRDFKTGVVALAIKIVAFFTYFESSFLKKIPGHGVHLTFVKKS